MGTLMAYGPDVVGLPGGPPHGLVELWKNSNIGSNFAAQNVEIDGVDPTKIDAIIVTIEPKKNETGGAIWFEFDTDILAIQGYSGYVELPYVLRAEGRVGEYYRGISFSLTGTTLTVAFTGAFNRQITTYGSTATDSADDSKAIPVRILGLLHED